MKNTTKSRRLSIVIFCCLVAHSCLLPAAPALAAYRVRSVGISPVLGGGYGASRGFAGGIHVPLARPLGLSAGFVPTLAPLLQVSAQAPVIAAARELSVSRVSPLALASIQAFELSSRKLGRSVALDALFGEKRGFGLAGEGNGSVRKADELESFTEYAKSLFFPDGREAVVAVSRGVRPEGELPSEQEMHDRMALSPLTNPEREAAVKDLFTRAGARPEEIISQDAGRGSSNYYVVKKGKTDRVVVVGAHHDKVSEGAGTIDNWTGATMMINLYQALRGVETDATYVFIAFAREEAGLIGSAAYVRSLKPAQRAKIDAMVNLDTLAVDGTFSWKNNSDRVLLDLIQKVADKEKYALEEAYLNGGDADSSTFRDAGIPAMTVFGASQDVIFDIIHSARDNMSAFSLAHYKNAYLLTLALLKALSLGPVRGAAGA